MTALEREGGKQSHLLLSGTCGARAGRRPRTHLELCRPGPGHGTGGRPRSRGPRGPGALRPVDARRGESWQPGAPLRFACSSWLRRPLPRGQGTLRRCPRPHDSRQRLKTRRSDRERPARPSAALPGALHSGLGLRSPLCGHLPSLPELHERLRAAAHPRLTPRPPRPQPIVSSQQRRRRGRAKPCLPPALGIAPRVPAPRRGLGPSSAAPQRPAARRSLSRRRPRAALRPSCASPPPLPAGRPASRAPPPSSSPAGPSARPNPCGGARSPPALLPPLPREASAASARTSLPGAWLGTSCTSGTREGMRVRREGQPDLGQLNLPEEGAGERGGGSWAEDESRGCGGAGAALLRRRRIGGF